jgi:hypothetical protein
MRKVAAQEIENIDALHKFYSTPDRSSEAVLRVIHVQNAHWATKWLLRKFNIKNQDPLVGTDFGKYVSYKRPERRGGKPFLSGKTWGTQHDPWRGISKTSFGLDYLKEYRASDPLSDRRGDDADKMMELNGWDEQDQPAYGFDVFVQRLSVYIQHKEVNPELPTDPDIISPYRQKENGNTDKKGRTLSYIPRLESLDNGNAIIIFENSHTGSIEDTVIEARQEWESRWRRLPFYLAYESHDVSNDDKMAIQCMKIILQDVLKGIVTKWDSLLDVAVNHVSILEDKIYEQPADETRAPELWTNSSNWLKIEKLMFIHIDIVKDMRARLRELVEDVDTEDNWLEDIPGDFARLSNLVEEDLTKPTAALSSLMYQSVSIRDSRHSLQLGTSMWRLSWITFIFLPLTFIVGFFGMNVSTFENYPDIKWYFVAAVPFMLCVLLAWFIMKTFLARQRQTPYQRGIWEHFFYDMAVSTPQLWSRAGPRDYVLPKGRLPRLKWRLIKWWTAPEKTLHAANVNAEGAVPDDLGSWSRLKKLLIKRWTAQIKASLSSPSSLEDGEADASDTGLIAEGLGEATELAALPGVPQVAETMPGGLLEIPIDPRVKIERRLPSPSPRRSGTQGRPESRSSSGGRNSGILVEEEDSKWLSERGREGKGWGWKSDWTEWRRRRSGSRDGRSEGEQERKREGVRTASPLGQAQVTSQDARRLVEAEVRDESQLVQEHVREKSEEVGGEKEQGKENVRGSDVPERGDEDVGKEGSGGA